MQGDNPLITQLEQTLMRLQSDQIIQQMRNDPTLAREQWQYIREVIREELAPIQDTEALVQENLDLQEQLREEAEKGERAREAYCAELDKIGLEIGEKVREVKRIEQEAASKEREKLKKQLERAHKQQVDQLKEDIETKQQEVDKLKRQLQTCRQESEGLRYDLRRAESETESLKSSKMMLEEGAVVKQQELMKLSVQLQGKHAKAIKELKESHELQLEQQLSEAREQIAAMERDMHLIKQSWEGKCQELVEENNRMALEYEERLRRELKEHAESLQMGNSVIIQDSDDIVNRKVELAERNFREQFAILQEDMAQIREAYEQTSHEIERKEHVAQELTRKLQLKTREVEDLEETKESESRSRKEEVKTLEQQRDELARKNEELKRKIAEVEEEMITLTRKHSHLMTEKQQLLNQVSKNKEHIQSVSTKNNEITQQIIDLKAALRQKQKEVQSYHEETQKAKETILSLQKQFQEEKSVHKATLAELKSMKQSHRRKMDRIDQLRVTIHRLRTDYRLAQEDIQGSISLMRNKMNSWGSSVGDKLSEVIDGQARRHKSKMEELLDDLQVKENEIQEEATNIREEARLKNQENNLTLQERETEIKRLKTIMVQVEEERTEMSRLLQREKDEVFRQQQAIRELENHYSDRLDKVQKEVNVLMMNFQQKWGQEINSLQGELEKRQAKVKELTSAVESKEGEMREIVRARQWMEEDVKRYRAKYEDVRLERDEKVQSFIRKYEQEHKYRLNLERQLKEVRLTLMRGAPQPTSQTNISFGQPSQKFATQAKPPQTNEREKQLSEIREMIAKTYKVVNEGNAAERDLSKNPSKRVLF